MATLTVLYFAHLRDHRGLDQEQLTTTAATPRGLYQELTQRHGFSLPERSVMVAINETMAQWETPLRDGDTIVFLPPISGG
ncbi:MAG: MoaD/ThiS family protein [Planctomycetota bacterium]